jgi:hypothetical protein
MMHDVFLVYLLTCSLPAVTLASVLVHKYL